MDAPTGHPQPLIAQGAHRILVVTGPGPHVEHADVVGVKGTWP